MYMYRRLTVARIYCGDRLCHAREINGAFWTANYIEPRVYKVMNRVDFIRDGDIEIF